MPPNYNNMFDRNEIFKIVLFSIILSFISIFLTINVEAQAADVYRLDSDNNKWVVENIGGTIDLFPATGQNPSDIFDSDALNTFATGRCSGSCSSPSHSEANIFINASSSSARFVNSLSANLNFSGDSNMFMIINISVFDLSSSSYLRVASNIFDDGGTFHPASGTARNVTVSFDPIFSNSTKFNLRYRLSTNANTDNQKINFRDLRLNILNQNIHTQYIGKISNTSTMKQASEVFNNTILPSEVFQIRANSFTTSSGSFYVYVPRLIFFNVSGFSQSLVGFPGGIDETDNSCQAASKLLTENVNIGKFNNTNVTVYDEYLFTPSSAVTCSFRWQISTFSPLPTNFTQVWVASFNQSTDFWRIANITYNTDTVGVNIISANKESIRITCASALSFCENDGIDNFVRGTNIQSYGFGVKVANAIFDASTTDTTLFSATNFRAKFITKEQNFTVTDTASSQNPQMWNVTFTFNPSRNDSWVGRDIYLLVNERFCFPDTVKVFVNSFRAESLDINLDNNFYNIASFRTRLRTPNEPCTNAYGDDRLKLFYIDRIADYHNNVTSYNVRFEVKKPVGNGGNVFSLPLMDFNGLKPFVDAAFTQYTITSNTDNSGVSGDSVSQNFGLIFAANATSSIPLPISTGLFTYNFNVSNSKTLQPVEGASVTLFGLNETTICVTNVTGSCSSVTTKEEKSIEIGKSGFNSFGFNTCFLPNTCTLAISPIFSSININVLLNESTISNDPTFGGFSTVGGLTDQVIIFFGNFSRTIPDKIEINITRTKAEELFIQTFRVDRTSKIPRLQSGLSVVWNVTEASTFNYVYPIFGASSADNEDAYILQVRNSTIDRFNQTKFFITSNGNISALDFGLSPQVLSSLVDSSNNDIQVLIARNIDQSIRFAEEELKIDYLKTLNWIFRTETGFFLPNMIWLIILSLFISFVASVRRGTI